MSWHSELADNAYYNSLHNNNNRVLNDISNDMNINRSNVQQRDLPGFVSDARSKTNSDTLKSVRPNSNEAGGGGMSISEMAFKVKMLQHTLDSFQKKTGGDFDAFYQSLERRTVNLREEMGNKFDHSSQVLDVFCVTTERGREEELSLCVCVLFVPFVAGIHFIQTRCFQCGMRTHLSLLSVCSS